MYIFRQIFNKSIKGATRVWSSIKFLFPRFVGLVSINFLRKTNTFIKSKYSKNRQWSKSIVYFGLWFGVISAFTFTYFNYRFLFSFSYLWWIGALVPFIVFYNGVKKYGHKLKLNIINYFI